ncbi:MAG: hypothetical protein WAP24_06155 [Thermacetogeniaceae bacterium]|jgi:hypothetical protein
MSLPEPFPQIKIKHYNPAIRLFGNRFFKDQTVLEYLAEFLAVVFSEKRIGDDGEAFLSPLPSIKELNEWPTSKPLCYRPPVKLNLKLFAFLSCSRADSRDESHTEHYKQLVKKLEASIRTSNRSVQDVRDWLEEFLRCFQGVGLNRTWCAQTFFPVSSNLVTQETIWNESQAKRNNITSWEEAIKDFNSYYGSKRIFFARGGELLYLQLCNLFTIEKSKISEFAKEMQIEDGNEIDMDKLHRSLQDGLRKLRGQNMQHFNKLVDYIEFLDKNTHSLINNETKYVASEWCPRDSWQEAYLFAIEINRLLAASLEPIERLELLMTGCSLQVLRSLCAQSVRYAKGFNTTGTGGKLGYAWIFSSLGLSSRQQRLTAQRNLNYIQGIIQKALRNDELHKNAERHPRKTVEQLYREADDRYGHKLLISLGKRLGIIIPKTGAQARFVMTDRLLRYLVLVLLKPGEKCTDDEFRQRLYRHYGIAVEGKELEDAVLWTGLPANSSIQPQESWLTEMLRAGGFLTELSDACSIVKNDFK